MRWRLAWSRLSAGTAAVALFAAAGCADRRAPARSPRPAPPPVPLAATPAPTPVATPTPVPPALACIAATECVLTPYGRTVPNTGACYCPTCPVPRNAAIAAANETDWRRLCGSAWADAHCLAPMCPRPVAPECRAGACARPVSGAAAGAPPG